MEPDSYEIKIVYFMHPHLVWAEVTDAQNTGTCLYEQLGLYGILPVENSIDLDNECLTTKTCEEWAPDVKKILDQLLSQAIAVWFSTTHIDRRSSIFENKIHKYGEISFKTKSGQVKKLSQLLVKSNLACYDEAAFYQALTTSKLTTKLSQDDRKKVMSLLGTTNLHGKEDITLSKTSSSDENQLTVANVEKHDELLASKNSIRNLMVTKYLDHSPCEDNDPNNCNDEVSVGRGSRFRKKSTQIDNAKQTTSTSSVISKRLDIYRKLADNHNQEEKVKQKLLDNLDKYQMGIDNIDSVSQTDDKDKDFDKNENIDITEPQKTSFHRKKATKVRREKLPDFDIHTQMRVGYGPPDIDKSKLPIKIISLNEPSNKPIHNVSSPKAEESNQKESLFAQVDSEVDFPTIKAKPKCYDLRKDRKELKTDEKIPEKTFTENVIAKRLRIAKTLKKMYDTTDNISDAETSTKDTLVTLNDTKSIDQGSLSEQEENHITEKIKSNYMKTTTPEASAVMNTAPQVNVVNYVNPFRNIDESLSKFTENLVSPVLLVHSKENKPIQPKCEINQINFSAHIHAALNSMKIKKPMLLQSISWFSILRGNSFFMVSPMNSGKTLGYIPAVCRMVADFDITEVPGSIGPICIIVCATALSVDNVFNTCRRFLPSKNVLYCYAGVDERKITENLLNGCEILVSTPPFLCRLMNIEDFGVDLKRLTTFVLDDFERLSNVYLDEVKFFSLKTREMLKHRVNKILKVQFIVASRVWCQYMETLANKSPMPVICIGAFQECVLYSKSPMTVNLVQSSKKIDFFLNFITEIDLSKKTVVVCRTDDEVAILTKVLESKKVLVYSADNSMTTETCYVLNNNWSSYDDPVTGVFLVCVDYNLTLLNVTDAHNLINYSLPNTFSNFCKRFSVLVDYYSSVFNYSNPAIKIKTLVDETNTEQLPKIINFLKRCSADIPVVLDRQCEVILKEKDLAKANHFVPFCSKMLLYGECPDYWDCIERHTVFKEYDEPASWVPIKGYVKFTILHYHSAVLFSARLLSNDVGTTVNKIPQTYMEISFKMGTHYCSDVNRIPHGKPKLGDVCAVAVQENLFKRCQVVKILSKYENGKPNAVLVRLIDEEKLEKTRDMYLYQLPDKLKNIQPQVVIVGLANIKPKDRDICFSDIARDQLIKKTEIQENLYFSGNVVLTLGNNILIENMEACQDLTAIHRTVVLFNVKEELLKAHAMTNAEHIPKLKNICKESGLNIESTLIFPSETKPANKILPKPHWAHLEEDFQNIFFASAENPSNFFIRLVKFDDCLKLLTNDIQKYVKDENVNYLESVNSEDLVLAKFDDDCYYRARIDRLLDETQVDCFFVDHGDRRVVNIKELYPITDMFITRLPFQAIECKLIGLKPIGKEWNEYSTNWFCDQYYIDSTNDYLKELYVKYYSKEIAECTGGHKYGIVIIDTTTDVDVVINKNMLECNLASEDEHSIHHLHELGFKRKESPVSYTDSEEEFEYSPNQNRVTNTDIAQITPHSSGASKLLFQKPIRSVPLVGSDESDMDIDRWDVNFTLEEIKSIFNQANNESSAKSNEPQVTKTISLENRIESDVKNNSIKESSSLSDSSNKDFVVVETPKLKIQELDSDDFSSSEHSVDYSKTQLKPKLYWSQNKSMVTLKIDLGVENYELDIQPRSIKFFTQYSDLLYGFHLNLYGVIDVKKCTHTAKGLYVLVKLLKQKPKLWQALTLDQNIKKWVIYDPDALVVDSSDDDCNNGFINAAKQAVKCSVDSYDIESSNGSEDMNFRDDIAVSYKDDGTTLD